MLFGAARQLSAAAAVRVGGWWFQSSLEGLELGFPSKFSETRVAGCFRSCPALCECASGCFSAACARALAAGGTRAGAPGCPLGTDVAVAAFVRGPGHAHASGIAAQAR